MFVLFFLVVVLQCFDCIQANTTFAFGSVSSSRPYLECVRVAHLLFIFFGFSFFSMSPFIEINRDPQKKITVCPISCSNRVSSVANNNAMPLFSMRQIQSKSCKQAGLLH